MAIHEFELKPYPARGIADYRVVDDAKSGLRTALATFLVRAKEAAS